MIAPQKIELEDLKSLSENQIQVIKENKITTIAQLAEKNALELKLLLSTTINKANLVLKEARAALPPFIVYTAANLLKKNSERTYISLKNKALDSLLGGKGLECGSITEFYGAFGSGKTQTVLSAVAATLLPHDNNPEGRDVIIIDTESTFEPERLVQILSYYDTKYDLTNPQYLKNIEEILSRILIIRPDSSTEQRLVLKDFMDQQCTGYFKYVSNVSKFNVGLIIVDSLTSLFRAQHVGLGTLSERQQKLNNHLRDIMIFCEKTNAACIVTNQVSSNPNPFSFGDTAVGGNVVAHGTKFRVLFTKRGNAKYRVAKLVDSSKLAPKEVVFKIGSRGLMEAEEEEVEPAEYIRIYNKSIEKEQTKSLQKEEEEEEEEENQKIVEQDETVQEPKTKKRKTLDVKVIHPKVETIIDEKIPVGQEHGIATGF